MAVNVKGAAAVIPQPQIPVGKQIRNFLWILFLGIAAGGLCVLFLVMYYGPSGKYQAKNTLLAPSTLSKLWYSDINPKTGGNSRFVFQKIEFVDRERTTLDDKQYQAFYTLIGNDKSLLEPADEIIRLFESKQLARIVVTVQTESDAAWQSATKVFQQVELVPEGNYYRIELHEDNPGVHWAYFYHPGIYRDALQLFKKESL